MKAENGATNQGLVKLANLCLSILRRRSHSGSEPLKFKEVLAAEASVIARTREHLNFKRVDESNLDSTGFASVCLSGGGIRSATFCLGCLQALDEGRLIQQFDYLSTVSGGGYTGSWLSKLIKTLPDKSISRNTQILVEVATAEDAMSGRSEADRTCVEPAALQFLRENSSYLTPRNGTLSGDTWSLIAIYLRNLILNWLLMLPLIAAAVALPYLCILLAESLPPWLRVSFSIVLAILAVLYPAIVPAWSDVGQEEKQRDSSKKDKQHYYWMQLRQFLWARLLPLESALFFLASFLSSKPPGIDSFWQGHVPQIIAATIFVVGFVCPAIVLLALGIYVSRESYGGRRKKPWEPGQRLIFAVQTAGSICSVAATVWLAIHLSSLAPIGSPISLFVSTGSPWFFVWFPALGTINFLVAGTLFAALVDPLIEDEDREWWARSAGYFLMFTVLWLIAASISVSGPTVFGLLLGTGIRGFAR